jgi:O-antigen ligase
VRWLAPLVVAGFLGAGTVKTTAPFDRLPIDLTVGLAGLTVLLVAWRALDRIPAPAVAVLAGFLVLVPPVLWTEASPYGDEKTSRFFTLTLLAALAPAVLIRDEGDARRFLWAVVAVDAATVLAVILAPQAVGTYAGAPVAALGSNTIGIGRSAGTIVVVAVLALMWRAASWYLAVAAGAAGVYALLQTGARGPLGAALLAVLAAALLSRERPAATRVAGALAVTGAAAVYAFALAPLYARERIATAAGGQVAGDIATRLHLYELAATSVATRPLGLGWGGYARIAPPGFRYPHDLPLEVLAEAGLVFGGLFLVWLGWAWVRVRWAARGLLGSAVFALLTFTLVDSLVSGDLNDNRDAFFFLGTGLALLAVRRRTAAPPAESVARTPG